MPPCRRYPQVPSLAQTGTPNLTIFCEPLLLIESCQEMTIKHLLYTQLCAFMYTKGACVVFFRFRNSPVKIFYDIQSVASILDQREYDILAHVMSMSHFRLAPKVGHIERMKRIYGYLSRTMHYALRFRTDEPNYMHLPDLEYDWTRIYGSVLEEIPKDAPEPLGKSVTTTTFLDANLLHDLITGRSVTAVLHFFNLTPGDWYSKRQATVENATYGSEFVASKTATEQIIDIRQTLRYLGVPIKSKAYMFGDNKSVVTSSTVPHSLLGKRHNILSYHRVREAIAAKILVFHWCDSSQSKSDILSKHWEFSKVFHIIRDLFDFQGKKTLIQ